MAALPVDVNYQLDGLPSTVKAASYVSRSTNGATFTSNNTVQFQLVNNDFVNWKSNFICVNLFNIYPTK